MEEWLRRLEREAEQWFKSENDPFKKSMWLTVIIIAVFSIAIWLINVWDYNEFKRIAHHSLPFLIGLALFAVLIVAYLKSWFDKLISPIVILKRLKNDFELEKWFAAMQEFSSKKGNHIKLIAKKRYSQFLIEFPKLMREAKDIINTKSDHLNEQQKEWQAKLKEEWNKLEKYSQQRLEKVKRSPFTQKASYTHIKELVQQFKNTKDKE